MTAVSMLVLIGVLGLAIDVGTFYHSRRVMQTAADAGALSGAAEIYRGQLEDVINLAGHTATAANGFAHGIGGIDVQVEHPPVSGDYVGDPQYAEVRIRQPSPTFFMGAFGYNSVPITARSVAGVHAAPLKNCVYVLDDAMAEAMVLRSSSRLNVDCGVIVNSSHECAVHIESSSFLKATDLSIVGDGDPLSLSGGGLCDETSDGGVDPFPAKSAPASDPLVYLDETLPSKEGCAHTNFSRDSGDHNLSPGVYCDGINLQNDAIANLEAGTYVLKGGGLRLEGNSKIYGTGVTFYNTEGDGYDYKPIELQSSTYAELSAPTTGDYAGILFHQDDEVGSVDPVEDKPYENRLDSSSFSTLEGALYFPTQILSIKSSSTLDAKNTLVVVRQLIVDSSGEFHIHAGYSGLPLGTSERLSLVE